MLRFGCRLLIWLWCVLFAFGLFVVCWLLRVCRLLFAMCVCFFGVLRSSFFECCCSLRCATCSLFCAMCSLFDLVCCLLLVVVSCVLLVVVLCCVLFIRVLLVVCYFVS